MEVVVELAETHIATADLVNLQVGDIITTDKDVHLPLVVSVEGRPKYHAAPGVYKGRKAIEVTDAIGGEPSIRRDAPAAAHEPKLNREALRSAKK